nr:MAG TPA: hypothetical protein [Caudoviricetes sp.]DAR58119.1 MAG TPA: hypothetical protein [Caudoviricetes sp.]DAS45071.1 MAG TPA: hypothetical protein [Caudoviricetes sp.]DAS56711.1 MAG TPA: hypothetical protein [Caudoviricetes sp.]DAX87303.1 MAG TPA: hypothetical protein [Caudoviricetes sp.]
MDVRLRACTLYPRLKQRSPPQEISSFYLYICLL